MKKILCASILAASLFTGAAFSAPECSAGGGCQQALQQKFPDAGPFFEHLYTLLDGMLEFLPPPAGDLGPAFFFYLPSDGANLDNVELYIESMGGDPEGRDGKVPMHPVNSHEKGVLAVAVEVLAIDKKLYCAVQSNEVSSDGGTLPTACSTSLKAAVEAAVQNAAGSRCLTT